MLPKTVQKRLGKGRDEETIERASSVLCARGVGISECRTLGTLDYPLSIDGSFTTSKLEVRCTDNCQHSRAEKEHRTPAESNFLTKVTSNGMISAKKTIALDETQWTESEGWAFVMIVAVHVLLLATAISTP
jgi:hypothetical protein